MALVPLSEVFVGLYLGLLAGLFPAFIAFVLGFLFKYLTDVTVPGFGVVVLGGALAGISGGLLGLVDPSLSQGWTGIVAVIVILMLCLWAHAQGDKLAANTPRRLGLAALEGDRVSENLADIVDAYGQLRIRPIGEIQDLEGYPPLPEDVRATLAAESWRFPAKLPRAELEVRLEERLITDHDLAEVSVEIDRKGHAEIAAAAAGAGLSRRVPAGKRAVSVETLLPTGLARGDVATLHLDEGEVTGPVVSARTGPADEAPRETTPDPAPTADESAPPPPAGGEVEQPPAPRAPTTRGGEGQVTVAVTVDEARRVLSTEEATMHVESQGKQREYQALQVLKAAGNRFRKVRIPDGSPLAGRTLGTARIRDTYGVAVLAVRRPTERVLAPTGATVLDAGDVLTVVGPPEGLDRFEGGIEPP